MSAQTFKGVIEAIEAHIDAIKDQHAAVYVRRGGPHQKEGLQLMRDYLARLAYPGMVTGPELLLADIVGLAVKEMRLKWPRT